MVVHVAKCMTSWDMHPPCLPSGHGAQQGESVASLLQIRRSIGQTCCHSPGCHAEFCQWLRRCGDGPLSLHLWPKVRLAWRVLLYCLVLKYSMLSLHWSTKALSNKVAAIPDVAVASATCFWARTAANMRFRVYVLPLPPHAFNAKMCPLLSATDARTASKTTRCWWLRVLYPSVTLLCKYATSYEVSSRNSLGSAAACAKARFDGGSQSWARANCC